MDRRLTTSLAIPTASILVFNILSTFIFLSILDQLILPKWRDLTGRCMTPLQRIGTGHVINILALVVSALVENQRLQVVKSHHLMDDDQPVSILVPMSVIWLVAPLVILGIAEAFHYPAQVTFYYQEFPISLRSTATAMMSLIMAIGLYLSSGVIGLIQRNTPWLPDDINKGRVDYLFWMMAGIGLLNFGYYLLCASSFKYHNVEKDDHEPSSPYVY